MKNFLKELDEAIGSEYANYDLNKIDFLYENFTPLNIIETLQENVQNSDYHFMTGNCGILALSLDLIFGNHENGSFVILSTDRGYDDSEDDFINEEDEDSELDYLSRLSMFGEMQHILWINKDGFIFDILGNHNNIDDAIIESNDFYDQLGYSEKKLMPVYFNKSQVDRVDLYIQILRGTLNEYEHPLELVNNLHDLLHPTLKKQNNKKHNL